MYISGTGLLSVILYTVCVATKSDQSYSLSPLYGKLPTANVSS